MSFLDDAYERLTDTVGDAVPATRRTDGTKFRQSVSNLVDYSRGKRELERDDTDTLNMGRAALEARGVKFADVWKEKRDTGTDWVAEYRTQADRATRNLTALLSRGFEFNDALYIAAAPGILDRTENVEQTAEWTQLFLEGERMMGMSPSEARTLWDSFDEKTRTKLRAQGFDIAQVESKLSGLGSVVDSVAGAAEVVSGGGLNWVGRKLAKGVGGTVEMLDDIAEQTVQRGYRAVDLAMRRSIESRQTGLTVHNGRVMTDPTAVTAGQQRFHTALKVVGDGDNTFRPGTFAEMKEIAGGNVDAVELAQLFAASKSPEEIIERLEIPEGDDAARTEAYLAIRKAERGPVMQQLIATANRNKLSPGRTVAQLVANDNPMVSGAVDATWRMFADPFLVGGKFLKAHRLARALPTDSIEAAIPIVNQRLGSFVDDIEDVGRRANEFGGGAASADAWAMVNLVDYPTYNQRLRRLDATPESKALIELVDHVFAHDGRFVQRYLRMRPKMEPLVNDVIEVRNMLRASPKRFTPQEEYRLAAQAIQDTLLPAQIAAGLGYTRRTQGAFMPRLTLAGTLKAQVAPKVHDVIDWTMQKAPVRLMDGSGIGVDDYEGATALLDEFVRYARADDIAPTRLEDFGVMKTFLEAKGYEPDVVAHALTRRVLVDIGVNETHGLPMDALARYAMSQGDPATPVYDNIVTALRSLDDLGVDPEDVVGVEADDLVAAFDKSIERYQEMFAALPDPHWATQALLQDGSFNTDLHELTSIFRGVWMEYAARHAVISPEEVARLKRIHGEKWVDHVVNVENADQRGLFMRLATGGRKDPTGGAAQWDEFYADIIEPLAERGSFRKVTELLREQKDALVAKYDQELIESLHYRLSDFRWDDSVQSARYRVHLPSGPRYIDDPDAYEDQLTGVLAKWQAGEIAGLEQDRAKLQAKLQWLTDPMAFQQLGLAAVAKAGRALTLFTRKIPKFGYVPFSGEHALGEFQKFLDLGVYGRKARELTMRFVNETDAGRRSVMFAAKRQLLHDTGILFNPHATDFVLSQLYEADFYYGGLRWIDNQGHARMSALLPDVQTAGGMAVPDIELIAFNADRNRIMSVISPVNGELSLLTKRFNHAFKQAAVFAPRLILRAGGLDESLSVLARHGIRDTTRMYAQSTLGRMRASTLSRDVVRTNVWHGWARRGQARLAVGDELPDAHYAISHGLLGNQHSFVKRWERVRAIEEYRAATRVGGATDVDRFDAAVRGLKRLGLDPKQMDEAVAPKWIDDMIERQWEEHQLLQAKIASGEIPDILADWRTFKHWVDNTEIEGMFDARVPIRETTGPGLHDAARWYGRFADRLINIGNKRFRLDMDEDLLRAANALATDPIIINAYNKNVAQTSIVASVYDVDPAQPISFEEVETLLRLRDDTGEFAKGSVTDVLGMQNLGVTGQILNASDLANLPAWGFMGAVPSAERRRIGQLLGDMDLPYVPFTRQGPLGDPYRDGTTRWHRLWSTVGDIEDDTERAFAAARARFAMAPDSYKQLVWDILDDAPNVRHQEINPFTLTAEYRDHLRANGLDPDEFGVTHEMVESLTDFFVRSDRQAANLVAWNDEFFRPSVAGANINALRAADAGTFFHGSSAPLQTIRPMDEAMQGDMLRMASGPGLYLSQNAPYSAGYAYMAQQIPTRGGAAVMNRVRLKPEFADHRIMHSITPTPEDQAVFRETLESFKAHVQADGGANLILLDTIDGMLSEAPNRFNYYTFWHRHLQPALSLHARPEEAARIQRLAKEGFYDELGRRGFAAFSDHDDKFATATPRLGDPFDPDENRHLVVFLDDVMETQDPVNYSMTAEMAEAEMLAVDPVSGKTRYEEEVDDWVHWVTGDWDPDAAVERIVQAQYRDLLRPERQAVVKRHDVISPDNDVRYNRSDDFVTIFVPRSKVGHTRLQLTEDQVNRGDQFVADAVASQAVLDGGATPSTYDILGSPDPVEAQRLLDFYSGGRPQDWDMVEVVVAKADWEKRVATLTKDDPRVAYVHDPFNHRAGRRVPAARTTDDQGNSNIEISADAEATSDPYRQLFAVNATEIDQAQVVTGQLGTTMEARWDEMKDSLLQSAQRSVDQREARYRDANGDVSGNFENLSAEWAAEDPANFLFSQVILAMSGEADRAGRTRTRLRAHRQNALTDAELARGALVDHASGLNSEESRLALEILDQRVAAGQPVLPGGLIPDPSDPGYRPVLAGKRVEQGIEQLADQMVRNLQGKMTDSFGVPVAQVLGPVTRGRFKADMVQDLDVNLPIDLIRPRMDAARYADADGVFRVVQSLRKARDSGFDMIGRGIAELARTPQFMRAYGDALRDAKGFRKASSSFQALDQHWATTFGDNFDDLREVLHAELGYATTQISTYAQVQDLADDAFTTLAAHFGVDLQASDLPTFRQWAAGELAWQNLEKAQAMTAALRKVSMFIDDQRVRSQFSQLFDVIWPFTYATEQFLTRWINTAVHSPEMFRRMALYYQGFYTSGVITEDAQGNDVYEIPFSGALTKGLAWVSQILPASLEVDPDLVPGTNMVGRIEYTFAGTTDPMELSAGPTLALPLAALRPLAPDLVIPFEKALISELGQGNSPLDTVLPSTLGRFTGAVETDHSLTIAAMQYIAAYKPELEPTFVKNDDGTIDGPTPAELQEYQSEVGRVAKVLHLARGITGLFSPAAPVQNLDPENLSEEFTQYLEAGVPIEEAVAQFLQDHPEATAYTIAKTESAGGAPIDPSEETLQALNQHRDFFDAYDLAGPYLLPHSGGAAEFDPLAWGELQALNYKVYRTGKEWFRAYSFAVGARQYFPSRDAKDAALEATTDPQARAAIRLAWKTWTGEFFAKYPLFADEVSSQEATRRRENVRRDMRKALDDPTLPESENASIIALLLETYDGLEHALADDRKYDSDSRRAAREAFHSWATEKVRGNFMAQAFYDRAIMRDLGVDDQPLGNTP